MENKAYISDINGENKYAELSGEIHKLIENGDLQFNELLDSDNVYATFDPTANPNILIGSQYSRYQINLPQDNSGNEIDIESVNFQSKNPIKVNLRYIYTKSDLSNIEGNLILNWNMNDSEKQLYLQMANTTSETQSETFSAPFSGNTNYIGNRKRGYSTLNYRIFNDIDRTQLMYIFSCSFFTINDDNTIQNINVPESDVIAHMQSDDEDFIYNGQTIYPSFITYIPKWKNNSYLWENETRTNLGQNSYPYFIVERYFENKLVHITSGIQTSLFSSQGNMYINNGFTVNWHSMKNWSNAVYNGGYTNCSSYGYTSLPDGNDENNFLQGYTPFPSDTDTLEFTDEIFTEFNPPSNRTIYNIYKKGNFFYIIQNSSRNTTQRGKTVTISPVITLKNICRQFALSLIPFCYRNNKNAYPTSSEYVLIGIRESDGSVQGKYEVYDWDNPQTEDKFRPDDFEPLVPTPDTPIVDEKDTGTTITGDSQFLRAPTNLTGCSGFLTHYVLTATQLSNFGAALWASFNDSSFWQALGAVFTDSLSINPADILKYIVSLRCYPVDLISSGISTTDKFYIGRGTLGIDIGGSVAYNTDMTLFKSCGSVHVPTFYNNYMDYTPYTTISIYLPFCGEFELNSTEVSGSTITVHYAIDFTTGICTAYVLNSLQGVDYLILTTSGQIGQDIQLTAGNLAPVAYNLATAAVAGMVGGVKGSELGLESGSVKETLLGALSGGASSFVSNIKPGLYSSHVNAGASFNAFYAPMTPFLKIKRARQSKASNWNATAGNITNRARYIGEMTGLIFCINPDCNGIPATKQELDMIKSILESGIHT